MNVIESIYMVWHERELADGCDDRKFIGAYGTQEEAEAAVRRAGLLPGFADFKEDFRIAPVTLGQDNWTTGFFAAVVPFWTLDTLAQEYEERNVGLAISVDANSGATSVRVRGGAEALEFLSDLIATVNRSAEGQYEISPLGALSNVFAVEGRLGLTIERDGEPLE